jgi:hypothetical protein
MGMHNVGTLCWLVSLPGRLLFRHFQPHRHTSCQARYESIHGRSLDGRGLDASLVLERRGHRRFAPQRSLLRLEMMYADTNLSSTVPVCDRRRPSARHPLGHG